MTRTVLRRALATTAVLAMVTVSLLLPQTGTAGSGKVAIVGHSVQGNVVIVGVENRANTAKTATVRVEVQLHSGHRVIGIKPTQVPKGQAAQVPISFLAPVKGVNEMKIIVEQDPF